MLQRLITLLIRLHNNCSRKRLLHSVTIVVNIKNNVGCWYIYILSVGQPDCNLHIYISVLSGKNIQVISLTLEVYIINQNLLRFVVDN